VQIEKANRDNVVKEKSEQKGKTKSKVPRGEIKIFEFTGLRVFHQDMINSED